MASQSPPIAFGDIKAEIFKAHEFTAYKCRFTLNLMKLVQKILKSTYLTQECVAVLFRLMEKSAELSATFNGNSRFRFVLWKKGYFSDINFLPSLHIFEINVLLAKYLFFKKNLSVENPRIFEFVVGVYENYIEKVAALEDAFVSFRADTAQEFAEPEVNRYYKLKNFEEKQMAVDFIYHLLNEQINTFLVDADLTAYAHLEVFDKLIDVLIDYLPVSDISRYAKFAPVGFVTGEKAENSISKLKDNVNVKDVLRKLIQLRKG